MSLVYDAGFEAGAATGGGGGSYDEGVEFGRQLAQDEFWADVQGRGSLKDYTASFGAWTNDENFKPQYDIIPTHARHMFARSKITDLVGILKRQGVTLDFSKATANNELSYLCYLSEITTLPTIDLRGHGNNNYNFYNATKLRSIEKIILDATGNNYNFTTTFDGCTSLVDVTFENFFKQSSVNMKWCPLSRASIESVMAALGDTASGKTLTLKQSAVNAVFTTEEWETLVATKPNWTITLSA